MRGPGGAQRGNTGCGAGRKPPEAFARAGIPPAENGTRSATGRKAENQEDTSRATEDVSPGQIRRLNSFLCRWRYGELSQREPREDEIHDVLRGSAREEYFGDAGFFQGRDVGFGDDAADEDGDVGHAFVVQKFHELGADGVVCAGEDG